MDKGIDKSQVDQAISELDSSDKELTCKAFNFLLANIGVEITDYQDHVRITNKLVELASSSDAETRQRIGNMCNAKKCNTNPELALPLAILAETEDNALRNEIKFNLNSIGSNYPIKCLEIIQRWLKSDVLQIGDRLCGILQQILKGDAKILDGFLRSWIAEEKNHKILMFGLPDLLFLYCRHYRICQSASILRQVERN